MDVLDVNKEYYDSLYKHKNLVLSLLHSFISFDQQSKSKLNYQSLRRFLSEGPKKRLRILDYGFGHGSLLLKYSSRHNLCGADLSEEAVNSFPRVAKLAGKHVQTATVDQFESKFEGLKFDIVTISHVIEHVKDDLKLLQFLSGRLSEKGIMLINIPINEVWEDPKHVRKYDIGYMKELVAKCDLKMDSYFEADKLTSFFLLEEKVKKAGRFQLIGIRLLRLIFAILPLAITRSFEKQFLRSHRNQQLIVLAKK